jgi:tRNA U34 5-carboxymethylaminomethyl modifying enzyme MnmG/GidA
MRTYYTGKLMDENLSVRDFVDICSYQFGAFIHLRDSDEAERKSNRIPVVSESHINSMREKQSELKEFLEIPEDHKKMRFNEWKQKRTAYYINSLKKEKQEYDKLKSAYDKINNTKFPENLSGLKRFCLEQLENTVKYRDCGYYTEQIAKIKRTDFEDWRTNTINELKRKIDYHFNEHTKEVERVKGRVAWIKELDEFLKALDEVK